MANFIIKAGKYNFKGTLVNIPNDIHPTINSKNDEDNIKDLLQSLETMINHIGKKGTDKDYIKINNVKDIILDEFEATSKSILGHTLEYIIYPDRENNNKKINKAIDSELKPLSGTQSKLPLNDLKNKIKKVRKKVEKSKEEQVKKIGAQIILPIENIISKTEIDNQKNLKLNFSGKLNNNIPDNSNNQLSFTYEIIDETIGQYKKYIKDFEKDTKNKIKNFDLFKEAKVKTEAPEDVLNNLRNLIARKIFAPSRLTKEYKKQLLGFVNREENKKYNFEPSLKKLEKIMETKINLEYSDSNFFNDIEKQYNEYSKKSKKPKDFVEYVSLSKSKKIHEGLEKAKTNLRNEIEELDYNRTQERIKQLKDVKFALEAGTVVSKGNSQSGYIKKILSEPILFKNEKEIWNFLAEDNLYGSISKAKENFDLSKIVKFNSSKDLEKFKNKYGKFGRDDRISEQIYDMPSKFRTQHTSNPDQFVRLSNHTLSAQSQIHYKLLDDAQTKLIDSLKTGKVLKNIKNNKEYDNILKNAFKQKNKEYEQQKNEYEEILKQEATSRVNKRIQILENINPSIRPVINDEKIKLEEIIGLMSLRAKANGENFNLIELTNQALKQQQALIQDIKSTDEQIKNIQEASAGTKQKYTSILSDKNKNEQEKLDAKKKIQYIDEEVNKKLKPLKNLKQNRINELEINKRIIKETVEKYLRENGINPKLIKNFMDSNSNMFNSKNNSSRQTFVSTKGEMFFGFGGGNNSNNKTVGIIEQYNEAISRVMANFALLKSTIGLFSDPISYYINQVKDYEKAIFDLGVVGQKSINEIKSLRSEFYEMGMTSMFSATELAKASSEIIRVGRSYDEAKQILAASERLATASFEDINKSTDAIIKAMTAFDLSAESAAHVANSFHNIANTTPLSLQTFDESLRQTAAAFGAIVHFSDKSGIELEEYKKQVLDTTAVLTGLQSVLGRTGAQSKIVLVCINSFNC